MKLNQFKTITCALSAAAAIVGTGAKIYFNEGPPPSVYQYAIIVACLWVIVEVQRRVVCNVSPTFTQRIWEVLPAGVARRPTLLFIKKPYWRTFSADFPIPHCVVIQCISFGTSLHLLARCDRQVCSIGIGVATSVESARLAAENVNIALQSKDFLLDEI